MKRGSWILGALLAWMGWAAPAHAQYMSPVFHRPIGYAPDMRGPGFYYPNCYGQMCGPYYYVVPPFCPETGVVMPFTVGGCGKRFKELYPTPQHLMNGTPAPQLNTYPTHPYMRSPRDFFMFREAMEDQMARETRPALIP